MGCADCPDIDTCNNSCIKADSKDKFTMTIDEAIKKLFDIDTALVSLRYYLIERGYNTALLSRADMDIINFMDYLEKRRK